MLWRASACPMAASIHHLIACGRSSGRHKVFLPWPPTCGCRKSHPVSMTREFPLCLHTQQDGKSRSIAWEMASAKLQLVQLNQVLSVAHQCDVARHRGHGEPL